MYQEKRCRKLLDHNEENNLSSDDEIDSTADSDKEEEIRDYSDDESNADSGL